MSCKTEKQMDFHVRIWNHDMVETRYHNSEFLGHISAEDMLEKFHSCKENLSFGNFIQLSMDGPSVNWKFYKMVQDELKNEYSCNLLNTGSCGIHIVHGAFKDGCEAAGWTVQKTLSTLFWLFKDSRARRGNYIILILIFGTVPGSSVPSTTPEMCSVPQTFLAQMPNKASFGFVYMLKIYWAVPEKH